MLIILHVAHRLFETKNTACCPKYKGLAMLKIGRCNRTTYTLQFNERISIAYL